MCYGAMTLIRGEDEVWRRTVVEWLSIPCAIASRSRRMGAHVPVASEPSHTDHVDGTSVPIVVVPTPVQYPVWTSEASSPADHALEFDRCVAIGAPIDI